MQEQINWFLEVLQDGLNSRYIGGFLNGFLTLFFYNKLQKYLMQKYEAKTPKDAIEQANYFFSDLKKFLDKYPRAFYLDQTREHGYIIGLDIDIFERLQKGKDVYSKFNHKFDFDNDDKNDGKINKKKINPE